MIYLILGSIIVLVGFGLMRSDIGQKVSYFGMLLFIIGLYVIFKGRKKIEKK